MFKLFTFKGPVSEPYFKILYLDSVSERMKVSVAIIQMYVFDPPDYRV